MKRIQSLALLLPLFMSGAMIGMQQAPKPPLNSPLMMACKAHNWKAVEQYLLANANVHQADENGDTPLHFAVVAGYSGMVYQLIQAGAQVDSINNDGLTPLMVAVLSNFPDLTRALLANGANRDLCHVQSGLSALEMAQGMAKDSFEGLPVFEAFNTLLPINAGLRTAQALTTPAVPNNAPLVAQADTRNPITWSEKGLDSKQTKERLDVKNDAQPRARNTLYGPYGKAKILYTREQLLAGLQSKALNPNEMYDTTEIAPLITAATRGDLEVVETLIDSGLEYIDEIDEGDETALHHAARNKHPLVVQLLIDSGAYIDAEDEEGYTPLMNAIRADNLATVKILVEAGANINHKNKKPESIMTRAVLTEDPILVQYLLDNNADYSLPDYKKNTPLQLCRERYAELPKSKECDPKTIALKRGKLEKIAQSIEAHSKKISDGTYLDLWKEENKKAREKKAQEALAAQEINTHGRLAQYYKLEKQFKQRKELSVAELKKLKEKYRSIHSTLMNAYYAGWETKRADRRYEILAEELSAKESSLNPKKTVTID